MQLLLCIFFLLFFLFSFFFIFISQAVTRQCVGGGWGGANLVRLHEQLAPSLLTPTTTPAHALSHTHSFFSVKTPLPVRTTPRRRLTRLDFCSVVWRRPVGVYGTEMAEGGGGREKGRCAGGKEKVNKLCAGKRQRWSVVLQVGAVLHLLLFFFLRGNLISLLSQGVATEGGRERERERGREKRENGARTLQYRKGVAGGEGGGGGDATAHLSCTWCCRCSTSVCTWWDGHASPLRLHWSTTLFVWDLLHSLYYYFYSLFVIFCCFF